MEVAPTASEPPAPSPAGVLEVHGALGDEGGGGLTLDGDFFVRSYLGVDVGGEAGKRGDIVSALYRVAVLDQVGYLDFQRGFSRVTQAEVFLKSRAGVALGEVEVVYREGGHHVVCRGDVGYHVGVGHGLGRSVIGD
jgi:hypothetical protein